MYWTHLLPLTSTASTRVRCLPVAHHHTVDALHALLGMASTALTPNWQIMSQTSEWRGRSNAYESYYQFL
jgi:hypothetical protein